MTNFQITSVEDGKKYWISRSVAVVMVPMFINAGNLWVPLGKRAPHLSEANKWGLPVGYLDWNETALEAVYRECWEELGLDIKRYFKLSEQPAMVVSDPRLDDQQVVSLRWTSWCWVPTLPELQPWDGEVTETKWVSIEGGWDDNRSEFAFNHVDLIHWAASNHFDDINHELIFV